jgi:hypothetical protein
MDRIYIIESPSLKDLEDDRKEGKALYESLLLADCDANYTIMESKKAFVKAIDHVIVDFYEKKGKFSAMPFIHISAHGNEDGIGLTNGEFLSWQEIRIELEKINQKIGYVMHVGDHSKEISRIVLCFSSCKGFNATKIYNNINPCPFQCVVGPKEDVLWSDALTAFITFYHLVNYKAFDFVSGTAQMNSSAGVDNVFEIFVSPEIGNNNSSPEMN